MDWIDIGLDRRAGFAERELASRERIGRAGDTLSGRAFPIDYTSSSLISPSDREIRELARSRAFKPIQSVDMSRPDDLQSSQKRFDGIRIPFHDDANATIDRVFHVPRHRVIAGQITNRNPHPNPLDSAG